MAHTDGASVHVRHMSLAAWLRVGALTVASLVAFGACGSCGSGTSGSSSSPSPAHTASPSASPSLIAGVQACTLVTAADASTAAGTTVTSLSSGVAVPGACFYVSADGNTSVVVYAQVFADSTAAQSFSADQLAAALTRGSGLANAKPVTGIGDKAIEYTTGATSNGIVIVVFKANVFMLIVITPSPGATKLEQLATTAVGRLGS